MQGTSPVVRVQKGCAPGKGSAGKTLSTLSTCSLRQCITHQSIFFAFLTTDFSLILAWFLRYYSDEVSEIGRWHESLDYGRSKNDHSRTEDEKELNRNQGMSYWYKASTAAASHLRIPQRAPQCGCSQITLPALACVYKLKLLGKKHEKCLFWETVISFSCADCTAPSLTSSTCCSG